MKLYAVYGGDGEPIEDTCLCAEHLTAENQHRANPNFNNPATWLLVPSLARYKSIRCIWCGSSYVTPDEPITEQPEYTDGPIGRVKKYHDELSELIEDPNPQHHLIHDCAVRLLLSLNTLYPTIK